MMPISIGSRRELLVDDFLIAEMRDASLRLHEPIPREAALVTDAPWEGAGCGYITVFEDDGRFRMYYKTFDIFRQHEGGSVLSIAYAESLDGVHWYKPELGRIEVEGSRRNNLVLRAGEKKQIDGILAGFHGFTPFKDRNPACPPEEVYKAVGSSTQVGLYAYVSPDGFDWRLAAKEPVIDTGYLDSQNQVFWDSVRGEYRAYCRDFHVLDDYGLGDDPMGIRVMDPKGLRDIFTATSPDFLHWDVKGFLDYPGSATQALYTNQVMPCPRAPHLFVGFPTRYVERKTSPTTDALPQRELRRARSAERDRYGGATTETVFMTSRDGTRFKRWDEAFIRPGLRLEHSWTYGDMGAGLGLILTPGELPGAPDELSFIVTENYWRLPGVTFRRYTLRQDGFVSLKAPYRGGEFTSHPLRFEGSRLSLNVSTAAAGRARVELQTPDGAPIPGFTLDECHDIVGDTLDYTAQWLKGADVSSLAGRPARMRVQMQDADLYSFRFVGE